MNAVETELIFNGGVCRYGNIKKFRVPNKTQVNIPSIKATILVVFKIVDLTVFFC